MERGITRAGAMLLNNTFLCINKLFLFMPKPCPRCGNVVDDDLTLCHNCGQKMGSPVRDNVKEQNNNVSTDFTMNIILTGFIGLACGYVISNWGLLAGLVVMGATYAIFLDYPGIYYLGIMGFFAFISMKAFGG